MHRYKNLNRIRQLDPIRDHCQIYHLMTGYEFPWEINRALELALLRTFCVPGISQLLLHSGEFHRRPQKRYDDTSIIVSELARWGYDSDRGREVIRRMNRMHGRFSIANEDFLYVLSTIVLEPVRWNAQYGWRRMCEQERLAGFYFWREVGKRMGIRSIPDTYEALEAFSLAYEREHFVYAQTNQHLGDTTRDLLVSWFPQWVRPLLVLTFPALLDESIQKALGLPKPNAVLQWVVTALLKTRALAMHVLPPRRQDAVLESSAYRSYPGGYRLSDLGPTELLPTLNQGHSSSPQGSRCPMRALWGRMGIKS